MKVVFILFIFLILTCLLLHRQFNHYELDDVHPSIQSVNHPYIKESKWLWIIPNYNNDPITNYPEWIEYIKNSGKKIGMHGVNHTYKEFGYNVSENYIQQGMNIWKKAFNEYPKYFKAPKLCLSINNKKLLEKKGMKIKGIYNQLLHKVYHTPENRFKNGRLKSE
jgi:predicted deacetylase